jgi:acetolactate decarboxylase
MRVLRRLVLVMLLAIALCGCSCSHQDRDTLFQVSAINALLAGVYDGDVTFEELSEHGDFGLGTFQALDGEMIALDGRFYQIRNDGVAYPADDAMKTPFAVVTYFEADRSERLDKCENYAQLEQHLDALLTTENIFYAIKVDGVFDYVKARSVPKQDKPYPPLAEAINDQSVFEFNDVGGTIVGFRCPEYVDGTNVPGYHFHFVTEDRQAGGHLLECRLQNVTVQIDYTSRFYMVLPESNDFYQTDLSQDNQGEPEEVEK